MNKLLTLETAFNVSIVLWLAAIGCLFIAPFPIAALFLMVASVCLSWAAHEILNVSHNTFVVLAIATPPIVVLALINFFRTSSLDSMLVTAVFSGLFVFSLRQIAALMRKKISKD